MESEPRKAPEVFTLRVWSESVGEDQTEWRGRVQHVASGETRYFRTWDALVEFLVHQIGAGTIKWPGADR
jgi:hypothetical protein